jgi:integrase
MSTDHLLPAETTTLDPTLDRQLISDIRAAGENEEAALSENTLRSYQTGWAQYAAWCRARYLEPLAPNAEQIATFLSSLVPSSDLEAKRKISTIKLRLAAIKHHLRNAGVTLDWKHPAIRNQMKGLARRNPGLVRQDPVQSLSLADLETMIRAIDLDLVGLRDRALILVGFAGAFRRSELARIEVEHVTAVAGGYEIWLGHTKTDDGDRDNVAVIVETGGVFCPVKAINAWMERARVIEGPVFRGFTGRGALRPTAITAQTVRLVLKSRAEAAGLDTREVQKGGRLITETVRWGGHSLRRGMATALSEATGGDVKAVQQAGRWKTPVTALRYVDGTRSADRSASARVMGKG